MVLASAAHALLTLNLLAAGGDLIAGNQQLCLVRPGGEGK